MLKLSGVYMIFNIHTNDYYIGSSCDLYKRFSNHKRLLSKNKNPCTHLQKAVNKYGNNYFYYIILEFCEKKYCLEREQHFIDTLAPRYNVCPIAGNSLGRIRTEKAIKNQFEAQRKYTDAEVIKMFYLYNKGISVSKISEIIKCKPNNISCILNKPKKYELVKVKYDLKIKHKKNKYRGFFKIILPNKEIIKVNNLTKFAKQNNLDAGNLNKCANKIYKTYKGIVVEKCNF